MSNSLWEIEKYLAIFKYFKGNLFFLLTQITDSYNWLCISKYHHLKVEQMMTKNVLPYFVDYINIKC